MLTDQYQRSAMLAAFRMGANAYLLKAMPFAAVFKSLELVMLGETIIPTALAFDDLDCERMHDRYDRRDEPRSAADPPLLSDREQCVLNCLLQGDSNKVIAKNLKIAEATVKVHVKAVFRKIHVHNRTQAAIWAVSNGVGSSRQEKPAVDSRIMSMIPAIPTSEHRVEVPQY